MTLSASDIVYTFSGGSTNSNPDNSLGGDPSVQPITNKRLFDDVTEEETAAGMTDYRCFYLNNDSGADTLYNALLYVESQVDGGADVLLGFDFQDERQTVAISNADGVSGGSFTMLYTDESGTTDFVVNWNSNYATLAANFQTAIRGVTYLEDVTVNASQSGTTVTLEINFVGTAGNRFHEILDLDSNDLTPAVAGITVVKVVNGSPINSIADEIDVDTTPPNSITFQPTSEVNPISLGDLRPLDSIPIWVKRIVASETEAIEGDGFVLRLTGSAIA